MYYIIHHAKKGSSCNPFIPMMNTAFLELDSHVLDGEDPRMQIEFQYVFDPCLYK